MDEIEDLEVHLATCPECARELARYREVLTAVSALRDVTEPPPVGFSQRVVAGVTTSPNRMRSRVVELAHDRRMHVAAASLGGAVVGATAMAIVWWRLAKRAVAGSGLPA